MIVQGRATKLTSVNGVNVVKEDIEELHSSQEESDTR